MKRSRNVLSAGSERKEDFFRSALGEDPKKRKITHDYSESPTRRVSVVPGPWQKNRVPLKQGFSAWKAAKQEIQPPNRSSPIELYSDEEEQQEYSDYDKEEDEDPYLSGSDKESENESSPHTGGQYDPMSDDDGDVIISDCEYNSEPEAEQDGNDSDAGTDSDENEDEYEDEDEWDKRTDGSQTRSNGPTVENAFGYDFGEDSALSFQEFTIQQYNKGKSKPIRTDHPKSHFKAIVEECERFQKEEEKLRYVPRIHEAISNSTYWQKQTCGDAILRKMRKTLDEFGYTRTDQQKIFHEHMINATIPIIYKDELQYYMDRILRENGWDEVKQELLCVTPRRFGKTWAVAMFVAALAICVPLIEIVIFSMAMRASRKMLGLVDKFVSVHTEGNKMIIRPHNQERLTLRGNSATDDIRCILSLPGRSEVCSIFYLCVYLHFCVRVSQLVS